MLEEPELLLLSDDEEMMGVWNPNISARLLNGEITLREDVFCVSMYMFNGMNEGCRRMVWICDWIVAGTEAAPLEVCGAEGRIG